MSRTFRRSSAAASRFDEGFEARVEQIREEARERAEERRLARDAREFARTGQIPAGRVGMRLT